MDDAVSRYCAASEAADIEVLMQTLTPDAELVSPISGRMVFRGHDDLKILLRAVYQTLTSLRWTAQIGDGEHRAAMGEARVGLTRPTDAMVFELAPDGRIRRSGPTFAHGWHRPYSRLCSRPRSPAVHT